MAAVDADVAVEAALRGSALGSAAAVQCRVPVIDMSGPAAEIEAALWAAANEVGFFTITNHGIAQQTIDAAFRASAQFFACTREEKEAMSPFAKELNSGYEFYSQVRPSTGTPDQKESLQITARAGAMDGRWPTKPEGFESAAQDLMKDAHELACRLLSLLQARACPDLEPGTLAKGHTLWADDGQCTLRMLHYPPVPTVDNAAGLWRAGPHTDWCCCTLLFQRPGEVGLECAANPRVAPAGSEKCGWAAVDPVEGGIAVNIGDMLSRWSDGRLYSNLHRVRMPVGEECERPRYSIAFFAQANKGCIIKSEQSPPITAGDYILGRIKSNFAQ
eukprot:scaffold308597_cov27-Tisochrysis_lutea.AAC.1